MPYIKNKNGDSVYIPSKYAKEELPTWSELYNDFYKNEDRSYDPDDESHNEIDIYWKLPHKKLLLGWVCNQFNKMIFEDGMKNHTLEFINDKFNDIFKTHISDIHFILDDHIPGLEEMGKLSYNELPLIYTCEIPSTNKRSIFASDLPSKNIKEFANKIFIQIILRGDSDDTFIVINEYNIYHEIFNAILTEMMNDIIIYFSGDVVGWKDSTGAIIPDEYGFKPGCGYDNGFNAGS